MSVWFVFAELSVDDLEHAARDRVAHVAIICAARFTILNEDLPDATISEPAHSRGVVQAVDLDLERLGCAPVREAFTIHDALATVAIVQAVGARHRDP